MTPTGFAGMRTTRSYWPDVAVVCPEEQSNRACHAHRPMSLCPGKLPPDCSGWHRDPSCGVGLEQEGIDTAGNIRLRFDAEPHYHHDHQCPRPVDQPIEHSLYIVDHDDDAIAEMSLAWFMVAIEGGVADPAVQCNRGGFPSHLADADGSRLVDVRVTGTRSHGSGNFLLGDPIRFKCWASRFATSFPTVQAWRPSQIVWAPAPFPDARNTYGLVRSLTRSISAPNIIDISWLDVSSGAYIEVG